MGYWLRKGGIIKIEHHSCWRKVRDDKDGVEFRTEDNRETRTMFRLGKSWVTTGGHNLKELKYNSTFAPTFYTTKKRALSEIKSAISRCPKTHKNRHGQIITEYSD